MPYRLPWEKSDLKDEIPQMAGVEQEKRDQCFKTLSREIGFLRVSPLHRYHALFGFDVLHVTSEG